MYLILQNQFLHNLLIVPFVPLLFLPSLALMTNLKRLYLYDNILR